MTDVVIHWIEGLGWDTRQEQGWPLHEGSYILEEPDRIVFITGMPGPGYVTEEGSVDANGFQFRVRGPAGGAHIAEDAARLLDSLVLGAAFPVQVDGVRLQHVHRLGSPPTPLPVNPQDLRHEFTAHYIVIVG